MYFYVLIHALCVSVHFRAINKCWNIIKWSYIRSASRVSHQFKAECQRDNIASLRSAFIMVSQNSLYMQAVRLVCVAPSVPPHPVSKFKTLVSCVKFFVGFLCVVHVLGLRRGGGRWWWQPISFPYTSVSLFSQGVFRWCPLRSFPVLSFLKVCHLGAWWFRGFPRGSPSLPVVPWVPFSL